MNQLKGFADRIDHKGAAGWAFDPDHPDVPVLLEIVDNDEVIDQIVADRFRGGLKEAGIGDGRHAFDIKFAKPLSPLTGHVVRIRRASDKQELKQSGVVLEAGVERRQSADEAIRFHIDHPVAAGGQVDLSGLYNLFVEGWAIAENGIDSITILLDGAPVGVATHGLPRKGVQDAFPDRSNALYSGFAFSAPSRPSEGRHVVSIVIRDKSGLTRTSEFTLVVSPPLRGPAAWSPRRQVPYTEAALKLGRLAAAGWLPTFLIVLRLASGAPAQIAAARLTLHSLRRQVYPEWKLALLAPDDAQDCRTVLIPATDNMSVRTIAPADWTEAGSPLFVVPLSAGDELGADALLEFALAGIGRPDIEFLYSDERCVDPGSGTVQPYFKPDWSPELLLSRNYIGRLWGAASALFTRAGGTPVQIAMTGEYDLVLRLTETAAAIAHVPHVLCTPGPGRQDDGADEEAALSAALARRGIAGDLLPGCLPGFHRVKRAVEHPGSVSIIMPTAGARGLYQTAIESVRELTGQRDFEIVAVENIPHEDAAAKQWLDRHADTVVSLPGPFNWSRFNNVGASRAHGDFLLFLNDDIEVLEPDWLDALLEHAQRPDVGVVGARLLYPDRTVQHAGMFLGESGGRHAFRFLPEDAPGPFGLALSQREVIAVTGACLMVRRAVFDALGGFDEAYDMINNDLDFCLRAHRAGLRNIITPYATLIHHEKASRATLDESFDPKRFDQATADLFAAGDPFFNPNLSKSNDNYAPEPEPVEILFPAVPLVPPGAVERIVVLKLDHIGDFVTAFPALHRLKAHFPRAELTVVAPAASVALAGMEPAIDRVISCDLFDLRDPAAGLDDDAAALAEQLYARGFDVAIDLRRQPETRPLLQQTGARWLAGFDVDGQFPWLDIAIPCGADTSRIPKQRHVSEDMLAIVDAVAGAFNRADVMPLSPRGEARIAMTDIPGMTEALAGWSGKRLAMIHPAAGAENRQWPAKNFAALIDLLAAEEDMRCLIIGAPEDDALARSVIDAVGEPDAARSLAGGIPLADLPALMRGCDLFVGNNSGPQHLAAVLGLPTVNVHPGIIDPREWGPIGPLAVSVRRAVTCSPCYLAHAEQCHRELACLQTLPPREVLRACRTVLDGQIQLDQATIRRK